MRAMSQRVVMISGEGDFVDKQSSRSRSRSPGADGSQPKRGPSPTRADISYHSQTFQTPVEKKGAVEFSYAVPTARFPLQPQGFSNPLKGKSLGIFGPENPLRNGLCNILVNPLTEPLILMLIVLQAILLAVESAPDVFERPRPPRWGSTNIDWAIFALFVVFTVELIAKVIVSGLVVNAEAYADPSTKGHVGERVAEQYRAIFQPQRQKSSRAPRQEAYGPSTLARSFTMMHVPAVASTFEEQQRLHLARRAFLRHGFNRLDFVAVVSFWVSFVIGISGVESQRHLFVFRMLSCLRIIRLLALTKGNLVRCRP